MKHNHTLDSVALILLLVGGICWGLVGLFSFDLIGSVFGVTLARIVFVLVGLAAVWSIVSWFQRKNVRK